MRVETDSDSDSDDDMLVLVFRTPVDVSGRGKRPMWSRLIFGIPGIPNTVVQYDDITAPAPPAQYIRSSHPSTKRWATPYLTTPPPRCVRCHQQYYRSGVVGVLVTTGPLAATSCKYHVEGNGISNVEWKFSAWGDITT
ncbi:hypothetical protein Bca4012_044613 [Brassica carinata]